MADPSALVNLERAHAEFTSYIALPVMHRRDQAGIIQAFEFTFELFWKTFQKLAPEVGLEALTPRDALQAGEKLRLISHDDAAHWAQMLRDRNLTSHVYRHEVADEVFGRIQAHYTRCFTNALVNLRARFAGD